MLHLCIKRERKPNLRLGQRLCTCTNATAFTCTREATRRLYLQDIGAFPRQKQFKPLHGHKPGTQSVSGATNPTEIHLLARQITRINTAHDHQELPICMSKNY